MHAIFGRTGPHEPNILQAMAQAMLHRGEDYATHTSEEITLCGEHLLHSQDGAISLACHGTAEHAAQLLVLYQQLGQAGFAQASTGFACAIYDAAQQQLVLARDHFGAKPLYYTMLDGQLAFATEIKALLAAGAPKQLNELALEQYLTFQYSVLEETFFKGIFKLLPGHCLVFAQGEIAVHEYWDAQFSPDDNAQLDDLADDIEQITQASIAQQAQVQGSFLSSGVDSSYIVASSRVPNTFTVGFDTGAYYNEATYAKELSDKLGLQHHNMLVPAQDYFAALPRMLWHADEPLADPAHMALHFVSELASEHVKEVFSGEGPDEFFGGYHVYREPLSLRHLTRLPMPLRRLLGKLASRLLPTGMKGRGYFIRGAQTVEQRFVGDAKIFSDAERKALLLRHAGSTAQDVTAPHYARVQHLDDTTKMQYLDIKLWLDGDILNGAEKITAAHGLQIHTPLLTRELFDIAARTPTKYRMSLADTKIAFRHAAKRKLPPEVAQKRKLGFPVPLRVWLREEQWANTVREAFASPTAQAYFNTGELLRLVDQHAAGKFDHSRKIWTVYCFLIWYREFLNERLGTRS
ncbi:MAG: asparagine synthase (glutamine-hydrolyzing) [Oscillospiraceae bacterium]|nr:asparagine synthase (glutamine-hydrolyzing) [Oscillospiraceae bacterium]